MSSEIWRQLRAEAEEVVHKEPLLASYVHACVLNHRDLASSLSFILANKLADGLMPIVTLQELFAEAYAAANDIIDCAAGDILAAYERDPAVCTFLPVILNLKGFQAIQVHRLAHFLWRGERSDLALFIQSRNSEVFGVDIHPACIMGKGIMFDHATGIVVGETSVIEDNVSILQQVTLGGTGNEQGDRHPKIKSGVLISTGAKVLGNISIGEGAKIGAGSVVLKDVPAHTTVVGVPARIVGETREPVPAQTMDQSLFED